MPSVPLLRGVAELAAGTGARHTFEFLLGRHLDANPRQYTLTPPDLAALMAALAGTPATVLDPACGTGALLRAVASRPDRVLYAQDGAPDLAALTALRLALHTRAPVHAAAGDTLRADAHPGLRADAVLCHPPFNERNWGHDELAYDPRWEYGFPRPHRVRAGVGAARARPAAGGRHRRPADAARRRVPPFRTADQGRPAAPGRAACRRRPAGRPARRPVQRPAASVGAAPPRPGARAAGGAARRRRTVHRRRARRSRLARGGETVLDAWQAFDGAGRIDQRPGLARSVPVIELLDDDVDLAPARHLPPPADTDGAGRLAGVRERLDETLRLTSRLAPPPAEPVPPAASGRLPLTTVGELARAGALVMRTGGHGGPARVPVLTDHDVLAGTAPSGTLPESEEEPVLTEAGDVVLPVLGGGAVARVVDEATAGAVLGRNLVLLRPDPAALDAWFLAGFLRGTANHRRASSYASTATRLDVRRLQLPRLAPDEQRRYGARFRDLDAFERALREAGRLGEQLVRGMYDGLTDGTIAPD